MVVFGFKVLNYMVFLAVNLAFITLVVRVIYFAAILKQDPIKAIIPDVKSNGLYKWLVLRELEKKNKEIGNQMS